MSRPRISTQPLRHVAVALLLVLIAPLALALPAQAQTLEVRGRGDIDHDRFLRRIIDEGAHTLVLRDTLIARTDTLPGPVLVAGATLRIDGVVAGDLVIVDANVFVRPTARILGGVRNIGGGFYPSEQASITGAVTAMPNAPYRVERRAGVISIVGMTQRSNLVRYGIGGLLLPTYDRVDALTVSLGAGLLLPRMGRLEPEVRGRAEYRTQRGEFGGALELAFVRGGTELDFGAERTTTTNERWIRSDLVNSLNGITLGKDRRDYFEVDRAWVELRRAQETGTRTMTAFLRTQVEDARSLPARDPWSVFGSFRDDNIEFADSRISSLIAGLALDLQRPRFTLELAASVEAAASVLDGDHTFNAYVVDADWAMAALANHTLLIETHFQGPLPGTERLPGQRWSFVGGSGTLLTFDEAEFRGDRIAMIESRYSIPFPERARMRLLGLPRIELLHMAGMAWTADERRSFEQNVGAQLSFTFLRLRAVTNPDRFSDDVEFSVGLRLPSRPYAWESPER